MRILFLDQYNQPGGAQHCLLDLLPAVLERAWKAVAMLPGEGELGRKIRDLGIEVFPVSAGPYASGYKTGGDLARFVRDVPSAARQIAECRRRARIDVIYVNGPRLVPAAAMGAGQAHMLFHCHSYLAPRYLEWLTGVPLGMRKATVVASSAFVAGPLRRWIPGQRIRVVHNGVPEGEQRRPRAGRRRIGIVGRIAPEKGQDVFLRAVRILQGDLPHCEFVVCGAPLFSDCSYEREIRGLAEGLPVEFTGWLDDVPSLLASLDLVVVPSAPIDATPRIIPQSFAAMVPVVAFANAGFQELIEDGKTGFLVSSRTPEALAGKIREVLEGRQSEAVVRAARDEWRARFSLGAYRRNLIKILEQMC